MMQIRIEMSSNYDLEGLPEEWPINTEGFVNAIDGAFSVVAPERDGSDIDHSLQCCIHICGLMEMFAAKAVSGNKALNVNKPLDLSSLPFGVPNGENWTDLEEAVEIRLLMVAR